MGKETVLELTEKNVKADLAVHVTLKAVKGLPIISGIIVRESVTAKPADIRPLVTYIDCGGKMRDMATIGKSEQFLHKDAVLIKAPTADLENIGRTLRYAFDKFAYKIPVHAPGKYDVTMVFCETSPVAYKVGYRVFDAWVRGKTTVKYSNIDVFKIAGEKKVYEITAQVEAEFSLNVEIKKGAASWPIISGIIVRRADPPVQVPYDPVAVIDCGNEMRMGEKHPLHATDKLLAQFKSDAQIYSENVLYKFFGQSFQACEGDFSYTLDVPFPGEYDVTLLFCATNSSCWNVGADVFDAVIRGRDSIELADIDVYRRVGKNRMLEIKEKKVAADLAIHIELKQKVGLPMISGIVVKPVKPATTEEDDSIPAPPVVEEEVDLRDPVSLDCGSLVPLEDLSDYVTSAQKTMCSSKPNLKVAGDNEVFAGYARHHRWGYKDFTYSAPISAPGQYDVTLVFAEIYPGTSEPGKRLFDVAIRGKSTFEFKDVDVAKEVGPNSVYTIQRSKLNADGMIHIDLKKGKKENPMISGIVITPSKN